MNNAISQIGFGDNVRVIEVDLTIQWKIAGLKGEVYGETVPSISNVEVIGELKHDFAINVHFEKLDESFWFASELLEFVNHNEGLTIGVGDKTWIRDAKGNWIEKTKVRKKNNIFDFFKRTSKS